MSSFQTFSHAYQKAIKADYTRNYAVKYAAKKYISRFLDSYNLEYISEDTESDLAKDFVQDYIEQRDKGRSHETGFISASAHFKHAVETLEKKEQRRGRENVRPPPLREDTDDLLEGFRGMHVHDAAPRRRHDSPHSYPRPRPERVYTTPLPRRYVPVNSHAPPMPSSHGRYAFPDPVYTVPQPADFPGREYFPNMAAPEDHFFPSASHTHHHQHRPTAATHAYTTQEFQPSVNSRRKDTHGHEYEAQRPRYTNPTYNSQRQRQPRYESPPSPRENPHRYNSYDAPRPPRPHYNTYHPSSPPPHARTHYTPPSPSPSPSPSSTPNLYALLGVSRTATPLQIKAAYRLSSLRHHPDRCADKNAATARMAEINMANDVLKDEGKRRVYDRTGRIDG